MTRLWKMTLVGAVALVAASGCKGSLKINAGEEQEEAPPPPPPPPPKKPPPKAPPPPVEDPSDVRVEGDHLVVDKKIHFGLNSAEIQPDSNELLDHIAQALNNHKEFTSVSVIGHTDSQGDAAANKQLSEARAQSVVKALESRGVKQQMRASGSGEDNLLCQEQTEECHQKNRRVEFKLDKRGG